MQCLVQTGSMSGSLGNNISDWKVDSIGVCAQIVCHIHCTLASQLAEKTARHIILRNYTILRYFTRSYQNVTNPMIIISASGHIRIRLCLLFLSTLTCMHTVFSLQYLFFSVWLRVHWAEKLTSVNMHRKHFWHARRKQKPKQKEILSWFFCSQNSLTSHLNNNYYGETAQNDIFVRTFVRLCVYGRTDWTVYVCMIDDQCLQNDNNAVHWTVTRQIPLRGALTMLRNILLFLIEMIIYSIGWLFWAKQMT